MSHESINGPLFVELSVKLSSGEFESRVNIPVSATTEQRDKFMQAWFDLLRQALEIAKIEAKEGECTNQ